MIKHCFSIIVAIFLISLCSTQLNANLVLVDSTKKYDNFTIEYLSDKTSSLSFDELQLSGFHETIPSQFTQGYKYGNAWFKLELKNNSKNEDFVLCFTEPFWSTLDLYTKNNSRWNIDKNGLNIPLDERKIKDVLPAFHFHINSGETQFLYVKGSTIASQIGEFQVYTEDEFFNPIRTTITEWYTIYCFVILIFILLNIYSYITTKDSIYIYYMTYVSTYIIFVSMHSGIYMSYGFTNWPEGLHVVGAFILISLLLFSIKYLELKTTYPLMNKVFKILTVVALVFALLLSQNIMYVNMISNIFFSIVIVIILVVAIKVLKDGFRGAKYYLVALMLYLPTMGIMAMNFNSLLPNTDLTRYIFLGGTFVEIFIFTLLLTDRSNIRLHEEVNKRKSIEENLLKANKEALASSESKSRFLATMSHEIRTPLNAIMGFSGLLKEKEKDSKKLKYLNIIDTASNSLINMLNDILDFSNIESGKLDMLYTPFNPKDECRVTEEMFKSQCEEKSLSLHSEYINLPLSLNGDILRIKQVLKHLLSNAIKFTPENKSIFLHAEYKDEHLNISVKDEGIGISDEYLGKIFEVFTQEDDSTTREYAGIGLGLTISNDLLKLMDSELKVKSEIGVGSEFYFSIPLKTGNDTEQGSLSNTDMDLSSLKILVVEDNKSNQLFMTMLLDTMDIECDIANDGLEGIEYFKDNMYDIILMDENMPNMNGIVATQEIRKLEKEESLDHTPIVAVTANALEGDREKFLSAGMDEYLTKPVNKKILMNTLSKFYEDMLEKN